MTKKEVRNTLIDLLDGLETPYTEGDDRPRAHVDEFLERLHSKGVVMKVEVEDYHDLPGGVWIQTVEPLIKEEE